MDFKTYIKKSLKDQKSSKKGNSSPNKYKPVKTLDTLIRDDKRNQGGKRMSMGGR